MTEPLVYVYCRPIYHGNRPAIELRRIIRLYDVHYKFDIDSALSSLASSKKSEQDKKKIKEEILKGSYKEFSTEEQCKEYVRKINTQYHIRAFIKRIDNSNAEVIKALLTCAFRERPVIVQPAFSDKLQAINSMIEKGFVWRRGYDDYPFKI
jgi:hypothetical protein